MEIQHGPTYKTQDVSSTFCLRPSIKISAGQTGQSSVELDGPLKISRASGPALKSTPVINSGWPRVFKNLVFEKIRPSKSLKMEVRY